MDNDSLMTLNPRGYCLKCHLPLKVIGLHFRCEGCGQGIAVQALEVAVLLNRPLPLRPPRDPNGYIEGEEWVFYPSGLLEGN